MINFLQNSKLIYSCESPSLKVVQRLRAFYYNVLAPSCKYNSILLSNSFNLKTHVDNVENITFNYVIIYLLPRFLHQLHLGLHAEWATTTKIIGFACVSKVESSTCGMSITIRHLFAYQMHLDSTPTSQPCTKIVALQKAFGLGHLYSTFTS